MSNISKDIEIPIIIESTKATNLSYEIFKEGDKSQDGVITRTLSEGIKIKSGFKILQGSVGIAEIFGLSFNFAPDIAISIASGIAANYLWEKMKSHRDIIAEVTIKGKKVKKDRDAIAQAFLEELQKLEDGKDNPKTNHFSPQ